MGFFATQPAPGVVHIATTRPFITLLKHFANVQSNNPYHTRRVAAQYMRDNQADFLPFLASVDGEDMPGATDDGLMTEDQFGEYCHRVEGTAEWGGEPEVSYCRAASSVVAELDKRHCSTSPASLMDLALLTSPL